MRKLSVILLAVLLGVLYLNLRPQQFVQPIGPNRRSTCLANLTQLESAKEQWAIDHHKKPGSQPRWKDVIGPYIKTKATCPDGGVYILGTVGTNPRCSHVGGEYPHVMP